MFWNKTVECMPRQELRALQEKKLKAVLAGAAGNSFYKNRYGNVEFKSMNDLHKLPFMKKSDFRDNYPFSMIVVPMENIIRLHCSSGTTGNPVVAPYTRNDIDQWSDMTARMLCAGGVTKHDIVQINMGYGLFTGGLGMHYGAERIGAAVLPTAAGGTDRQIKLIQDFGVTVLVAIPSYAMHMAERSRELGIDLSKSTLKHGVFGGEMWSNSARKKIEESFGITATDIYGLTELVGPGVAYECLERNGMHVSEDHFIVEVIDPKTEEVLEPGEKGELVFTTLTKEALPVIRFRTGDVSRIIEDKCECGRSFVRLEKIHGRTDDMIIVKGVNVYPSQIEHVIMSNAVSNYQILVEKDRSYNDNVTVFVECDKTDEKTKQDMEKKLYAALCLKIKVELVEKGTIPKGEGKAKRVVDKRVF
jgi:phenylacetate-CoA ligase